MSEILFYMEPLAGEWAAPPHPFLLAEQGEPEAGWVRSGPAALTRAWCIFELAKSLTKNCTLHVLLSPESVQLFEKIMTENHVFYAEAGRRGAVCRKQLKGAFQWVGKLLGGIDVKLAQISKVEDRSLLSRALPCSPLGQLDVSFRSVVYFPPLISL